MTMRLGPIFLCSEPQVSQHRPEIDTPRAKIAVFNELSDCTRIGKWMRARPTMGALESCDANAIRQQPIRR